MPGYIFGRTKGLPPQGRMNAGQKLHHATTFLMFVTVAASGFVLWFGKGRLGPDGLASTAMVHDLSMLGLTVMMIGHLYFTFVYDAFSACSPVLSPKSTPGWSIRNGLTRCHRRRVLSRRTCRKAWRPTTATPSPRCLDLEHASSASGIRPAHDPTAWRNVCSRRRCCSAFRHCVMPALPSSGTP